MGDLHIAIELFFDTEQFSTNNTDIFAYATVRLKITLGIGQVYNATF